MPLVLTGARLKKLAIGTYKLLVPASRIGHSYRQFTAGMTQRRPVRRFARSRARETAAKAAELILTIGRDGGTSGVRGVNHLLLQLPSVADLDFSWLAKVFSLMVLPFADEDFAIIFGGYFVVNRLMPVGLVAVAIYFGMVASDFAFYGIGAAARRIQWLRRFAVDDRVRNFADALCRNLFELVALCRVVPGLDLIAFVACGWTRVPLARFMLASLVISALYLPLMLYLVIVFGDALDDHAGLWTWPFLVAIVAVTGFVRNRIFSLREAVPSGDPVPEVRRPRSRFRLSQTSSRPAPIWRPRLGRLPAVPRTMRWLRSR
jgi:membrane protein DedA with SNARE-associated domain